MRSLESGPKNHDLSADLPLFDFEDGSSESVASSRQRLDRVVEGSFSIFVVVEP
ncbi:hypothetical protein BH24CHL8_BH24CHL8_08300 [soil metagenome]